MAATGGMAVVLAGAAVNAAFAVPMRFMRRWTFEHIWLAYSALALIVFPCALGFATVPHLIEVIFQSEEMAVLLFGLGLCWGVGQICFGKALHSLGISLATAIMLGIAIALGSALPLLVLKGNLEVMKWLLTLAMSVVGVLLCTGAANSRRCSDPPQDGLWLSVAAGIGAGLFNVAVAVGSPISANALRQGVRPEFAQMAAWLPFLVGGAIPNIAYCARKLMLNRTTALLYAPGTLNYWAAALLMAICWLGSSLLYGFGATRMGEAGLSFAYPIYISSIVLNTTLLGVVVGEWRGSSQRSKVLLQAGLVLLVASIWLAAHVRHAFAI